MILMANETKKYQPETGRADKHDSNTLFNARRFDNPSGATPMWDTERSTDATRLPVGTSFHKENAKPAKMDTSNPPATDLIAPAERDF